MKVLLVNGGPHKEGCTYTALTEIANTLKEEGVDSEIFWIGNKPISGCLGCRKCAEKHACIIDDKVNEFLDKAADFDGFIFGTPVHWAGATGAITSFLDRVFYAGFLRPQKQFLSQACGGGDVGPPGRYHCLMGQLNKYFGLMQMPIVTSRYWNMVHGGTPEQVRKDLEGMQCMRFLARNMAWFLRCKAAGEQAGIPFPKQEPVTFTNFIR